MELIPARKCDYPYLRDLYLKSFPKSEWKPFPFLRWRAKQDIMDLLILKDGGKNLGLTFTAKYQDLVLVDYFAIDPACRGQGVGSQAIPLWKELYPGKRIFLEIEQLLPSVPNYAQRVSRKHFYLKNGLRETGLFVNLFGEPMEVLSLTGTLNYEEYHQVYKRLVGPLCRCVQPLPPPEGKKL